nr:hypothetical protein CFP56_53742 [Quercus suber]
MGEIYVSLALIRLTSTMKRKICNCSTMLENELVPCISSADPIALSLRQSLLETASRPRAIDRSAVHPKWHDVHAAHSQCIAPETIFSTDTCLSLPVHSGLDESSCLLVCLPQTPFAAAYCDDSPQGLTLEKTQALLPREKETYNGSHDEHEVLASASLGRKVMAS